uniref:Uncharacterized protein n=1 Tax=Peronospora matthiolae TaxID=2874970 RepID=A0AAV1VGS9_9STRA
MDSDEPIGSVLVARSSASSIPKAGPIGPPLTEVLSTASVVSSGPVGCSRGEMSTPTEGAGPDCIIAEGDGAQLVGGKLGVDDGKTMEGNGRIKRKAVTKTCTSEPDIVGRLVQVAIVVKSIKIGVVKPQTCALVRSGNRRNDRGTTTNRMDGTVGTIHGSISSSQNGSERRKGPRSRDRDQGTAIEGPRSGDRDQGPRSRERDQGPRSRDRNQGPRSRDRDLAWTKP